MKRETAQRHSLKIIAIFFAVSLWFYVLNSEPVQIERKLAVHYILPKGLGIASLPVSEVTLKLKGSKAFIQNVFSNKERLNVDLNPYFVSSGKNFKVKFYASDVSIPFGVEILDISPKETTIELDRVVMTEFPVKVHFIGNPPKDRKIKELEVVPRDLMISGPAEIVKVVLHIDTAPVNLALMNKDEGSVSIGLVDLDPRLKFEESSRVKIKYRTQLINKRLNVK
ncbi:MAG: hypothetical protein KBD76_06715 [Bacteriovorax sp.]|jgi:YbbR domain-containing protein|nr:hypothetical protein [Bacteriovorax sp.]